MDLLTELRPFGKGRHQLAVVTTDLTEPESLIRALAEKEKERAPSDFAGKEACVYCKMPYVPPCETFKELRRLIIRIRENTGLRAHYRGVVALEVGEWMGHQREEYFTVLLKYLYDHRDCWRIGLVLPEAGANQIGRFLSDCSRYLTPRLFAVNVFGDEDTLRCLIRNEFSRNGKSAGKKTAELLAAALARPELEKIRSLTLIRRCVGELLFMAGKGKTVGVELVREYLLDPDCLLSMLAGKPLYDERSIALAKETLQLRG